MGTPDGWRDDADPEMVELGVARCLATVMTRDMWHELGLLTDTRDYLVAHPRLIRSLQFGDDDYRSCVFEVTSVILGRTRKSSLRRIPSERFPNLDRVSAYLSLPEWLATNDPAIHNQVCTVSKPASDATMPDGTVLDAGAGAAARLSVSEMRRQIERIRRDYSSDPEAVIGQVKELTETACKTILGLTGSSSEAAIGMPELVSKTLRHLGLHPSELGAGRDALEAHALKRIFGGLTSTLLGAAELRNSRGTGHGRSGAPLVDASLARLTAGMALPAIVYLCEAYEASATGTGTAEPTSIIGTMPQPAGNDTHDGLEKSAFRVGLNVRPGMQVEHKTFGRGITISTHGAGEESEALVEFAPEIGPKRLLLRFAPLREEKQ